MLETKVASVMTVAEAELEGHVDSLMKKRIAEIADELKEQTSSLFKSINQLIDKRWVFFENKKAFYDNEVVALYPDMDYFDCKRITNINISAVLTEWLKFDGMQGELPLYEELRKSFHPNVIAPIKDLNSSLRCGKSELDDFVGFKQGNNYYSYIVTDDNTSTGTYYRTVLPIYRLNGENSPVIPHQEVIALFIKNKLIPKGLSEQEIEQFKQLMNLSFIFIKDKIIYLDEEKLFESVKKGTIKQFFKQTLDYEKLEEGLRNHTEKIPNESIVDMLLNCEYERADIEPYDEKLLTDPNRGHWDLWPIGEQEGFVEIAVTDGLVMRDPRSSIKADGVIGIDFGTKSTVVVHQENQDYTLPMRIGVGRLGKQIEAHHYENPTIMEFVDLQTFIEAYEEKAGRPSTKWADLRVSHTAMNSLKDTLSSDQYYTVLSDIKQWAGDKKRQIRLSDQRGQEIILPSFLDLSEDNINPIELYAYYIGLYINNMHNGIYLDYTLSFPVTYEKDVRDKIIESFENGLKKSLPIPVLEDEDVMSAFRVTSGASEPAAYAVCAMQEYGFEPEDDEKVFYGVFDFGGGTTDFDFGIWRAANNKERRFDFVIEHFGAGGDKYLGGENLLELLAFEVFKANQDALREAQIVFMLPPECQKFAGSELLLTDSQEAKLNMKHLMEALRPFWEQHEGFEQMFDRGVLRIKLYKKDGQVLENFELTVETEHLSEVIYDRVEQGIRNFFYALGQAKKHELVEGVEEVFILLSGNSSKAAIVQTLFEQYIDETDDELQISILPPLGTEAAAVIQRENGVNVDEDSIIRPTGKTGVAFGLVMSRKGGKIKVVDHNVVEDEVKFKYYIGESRRNKFKVIIDRNNSYNTWFEFIDASESDFELYYTALPEAQNNDLPISSVQRKKCRIEQTNDEANVYLRTVGPTTIEYVVATEQGLMQEDYLTSIVKIEL